MTLIRIGDRHINLDNLTQARHYDDGSISLWFTDGDREPTSFRMHEAIALRSWLDGRASDVLRLYELEQAARNG